MNWVAEGEMCEAREQGKPLQGIAVKLVGQDAGRFDVMYQAHLQYVGDTTEFRNGEIATGTGPARQLEAIKVWLKER